MIRLLIIGRDADAWRDRLAPWTGETLEVVTEALPAAGIRSFAENSPDAVMVAEPADSEKRVPIVEAIRERPLGRIVPVVMAGSEPPEEVREEVASNIGREETGERLVSELEVLLEVELEAEPRHDRTTNRPDLEVGRSEAAADEEGPTFVSTEIPTVREGQDEPARTSPRGGRPERREAPEGEAGVERHDYLIEPLGGQSRETERTDGAPPREPGQHQGDARGAEAPDAAAVRRKLKQVRHEDYFVILDVPRGAGSGEVRQAYREMKARFRREGLDIQLAERFEAELDEINDALDDARAVLGDESLRERYLERTTRG